MFPGPTAESPRQGSGTPGQERSRPIPSGCLPQSLGRVAAAAEASRPVPRGGRSEPSRCRLVERGSRLLWRNVPRCEWLGQVSKARQLRALLSRAPRRRYRGERRGPAEHSAPVRRLRKPRRCLRFSEPPKIHSPRALSALPSSLRWFRVSAYPRLHPRSPRVSIPPSLCRIDVASERRGERACRCVCVHVIYYLHLPSKSCWHIHFQVQIAVVLHIPLSPICRQSPKIHP